MITFTFSEFLRYRYVESVKFDLRNHVKNITTQFNQYDPSKVQARVLCLICLEDEVK